MTQIPDCIVIEPVNVPYASDERFVFNVGFDGRLVVSIDLDFETLETRISPIDAEVFADLIAQAPAVINAMHFVGLCVAECGILAGQRFVDAH